MIHVQFLKMATLLLVALAQPSHAEVPLLLNYQGLIRTTSDSLVTRTISGSFSIYDSPTNGERLWSESQSIEAHQGRFHTLLGGSNPIPTNLFADANRYLTFSVNDDAEFLPRQRITSVAYAIVSSSADTASYSQRSGQAENVNDNNITPRSLSLSGGKATLDSTGSLTAEIVETDSVVIAGTGVIDRLGNWTGMPMDPGLEGMVLDTVIVKNVQESLTISTGDSDWRGLDEFTLFVRLDSPGLMSVQFSGLVTVLGGLETRLVIEKIVNGRRTDRQVNQGNVSGILTDGNQVYRSSSINNTAVYYLEDGLFLVSLERRINGSNPTLNTGILVMQVFTRL